MKYNFVSIVLAVSLILLNGCATSVKPQDLLGNNINHPNDFGHWIYYSVLARLGL